MPHVTVMELQRSPQQPRTRRAESLSAFRLPRQRAGKLWPQPGTGSAEKNKARLHCSEGLFRGSTGRKVAFSSLGNGEHQFPELEKFYRNSGNAERDYLMWQVRQSWLPSLAIRRKVGLKSLPAPALSTPWGSWHDAHSTSGPSPVS